MARHSGVTQLLRWFEYDHLPPDMQRISAPVGELADVMLDVIPLDSPELTEGLRKLLEAKDCFVRAAILSREAADTA